MLLGFVVKVTKGSFFGRRSGGGGGGLCFAFAFASGFGFGFYRLPTLWFTGKRAQIYNYRSPLSSFLHFSGLYFNFLFWDFEFLW